MLLIMAEALRTCAVYTAIPDSLLWDVLCRHQTHVEWVGCSVHDLIMPSFCFLVGVVLPFSIAGRVARGQSFRDLAWHTCLRIAGLLFLGVVVAWAYGRQLRWPFDWVLPQIALGYGFLFLLGFRRSRDAWIALLVILVAYWLLFALYPLPGSDFDYARVGVSAEWLHRNGLTGFAAHWQKNSNAAWAFDVWLYNSLPGAGPFSYWETGFATLNFIPTLGTMILGLIAGRVLQAGAGRWSTARSLTFMGVAFLASGWFLDRVGICPIVKWIWTPSWVLFSGGWCFMLLAAFHAAVDLLDNRRSAFPLIVIGANSIVAYLLAELYPAFAFNGLHRLVGIEPFTIFGAAYEPAVYGSVIVLGYWLVLFGMYRRRLFLRV
jgi:heparan-alpha-glucosaminide N-acetyltransferase